VLEIGASFGQTGLHPAAVGAQVLSVLPELHDASSNEPASWTMLRTLAIASLLTKVVAPATGDGEGDAHSRFTSWDHALLSPPPTASVLECDVLLGRQPLAAAHAKTAILTSSFTHIHVTDFAGVHDAPKPKPDIVDQGSPSEEQVVPLSSRLSRDVPLQLVQRAWASLGRIRFQPWKLGLDLHDLLLVDRKPFRIILG
jgi:hypothetical protein